MPRRQVAYLVVAAGVFMALVALLADSLGIGTSGFGWKRGVLLAVGVAVIAAGAWMATRAGSVAPDDADG